VQCDKRMLTHYLPTERATVVLYCLVLVHLLQYITLLFTDLGVLTPAAVSDELIQLYV
jgi:hypothetical protein